MLRQERSRHLEEEEGSKGTALDCQNLALKHTCATNNRLKLPKQHKSNNSVAIAAILVTQFPSFRGAPSMAKHFRSKIRSKSENTLKTFSEQTPEFPGSVRLEIPKPFRKGQGDHNPAPKLQNTQESCGCFRILRWGVGVSNSCALRMLRHAIFSGFCVLCSL